MNIDSTINSVTSTLYGRAILGVRWSEKLEDFESSKEFQQMNEFIGDYWQYTRFLQGPDGLFTRKDIVVVLSDRLGKLILKPSDWLFLDVETSKLSSVSDYTFRSMMATST